MPDNKKPKPAQKPLRFGEPEKPNWTRILLASFFIAGGIILIVWMVVSSPPQHALVCSERSGNGSWNAIGRCREAE